MSNIARKAQRQRQRDERKAKRAAERSDRQRLVNAIHAESVKRGQPMDRRAVHALLQVPGVAERMRAAGEGMRGEADYSGIDRQIG